MGLLVLTHQLTALERAIEEKNKTMGMYSSLFLTKDTRAKAQRMGRHRAVADNRAIISKHVPQTQPHCITNPWSPSHSIPALLHR